MIPRQDSDGAQVVSLKVYDDVEKALGLYWCLLNDEVFIKLELNDSDQKFLKEQNLPCGLKPKLTLKMCLHFHMKIFDPLGFLHLLR